jgi:hypothetical protein
MGLTTPITWASIDLRHSLREFLRVMLVLVQIGMKFAGRKS